MQVTVTASSSGPTSLPSALWFVLFTALFLVWVPSATAQISPGPLSRPHQSLNGSTNCASCHKFGGQAALKCLECHTEIATRLSAHKGLHATYNIPPGSSQECARCHSEHNGEDFPLIKWDIKTFNHKETGYLLEGKHAGLDCNKCHNPSRISPQERPSIKIKDLNRTYLGLSTACVPCHEDQHKGRLGPNCLQCHNFDDWKTHVSIGNEFDHSKTRYPLDRSACPGAVRQVPHQRRRRQAAVCRHSVQPVFRLPQGSAPRQLPARLPVLPQHRAVGRKSRCRRSTSASITRKPSTRWKASTRPSIAHSATPTATSRSLWLCGSAWTATSPIRTTDSLPNVRRWRVLLVPHRAGMEAFDVHGEGPRHQRVSAARRARARGVRQVPHPERQGHALQNQVRPLHRLPRRSARADSLSRRPISTPATAATISMDTSRRPSLLPSTRRRTSR